MTEVDPREVPILRELEHEYRRLVAQTLGTPPPTPAVTAARSRSEVAPGGAAWAGTVRRVLRRAGVAGALVGVVGATALATKSVVSRAPGPARPVVLRHADGHELAVRRHGGRLCLDVSFTGGVASRCFREPAPDGIAPLSATSPRGRVVVALTGADVMAAGVRADGHERVVTTRPLPDAAPGRRLRWLAVVLPAPAPGRATAAVLTPLRRTGAPAGPGVADCSLGSVASCRSARAREHSRGTLVNDP